MRKIIGVLIFLLVCYEAYNVLVNTTHFSGEKESFVYNKETMSLDELADSLYAKKIIREKLSFSLMAKVLKVAPKAKSGKFLVKRSTSLLTLIRMLRNNQQATVKFILNKVRTKGELAKLVATTFEADSAEYAAFFNNNDSLAPFNTDTTQLLSLFIPNTYEFYWSTSLPKFLQKMKDQQEAFWNANNRINKAKKLGMSPNEVYTLASIVEEECNFDSDKTLIASVYLNRLKLSMPLQACPTIKFAMQDFTITRIYEKYLTHPSPYNTYNKKGLPPGPICTPSPTTIDLVLNAPNTNYLYFVAKSDFSGYHHFSSTYGEHNKYADDYQKKLDEYQKKKAKENK
ncbi:MAG: endolytic transglycosylase MltG [Bacteroidota bacterium]|jgi:UPF0755 protein